MESVLLGPSGLSVSRVALGANQFGRRLDAGQSGLMVDVALDAGITFIDTSNNYPSGLGTSESVLGGALRGRRDRIVLATKFGSRLDGEPEDLKRGAAGYVRKAIEGSLKRLQTDWVDVYYHHFPDEGTPIAETLSAMEELVRSGLVRAIGLSNRSLPQLTEAFGAARSVGAIVAVVQNELNLLATRELDSTLPLCRERGVAFVPYQPLAGGLLTGKYGRGDVAAPDSILAAYGVTIDHWLDRIDACKRFAHERECSVLELALGALLSHPGIPAVICGATTPAQLEANIAAASWQLSEEDLRAAWALGNADPH